MSLTKSLSARPYMLHMHHTSTKDVSSNTPTELTSLHLLPLISNKPGIEVMDIIRAMGIVLDVSLH